MKSGGKTTPSRRDSMYENQEVRKSCHIFLTELQEAHGWRMEDKGNSDMTRELGVNQETVSDSYIKDFEKNCFISLNSVRLY